MASNEDHQQQEQNKGKRKNMEENNESNLSLGTLTFKEIYVGRYQCVETGHEMLSKDIESYKQSKPYKLALINFAMSQKPKKFPFSIFEHDPNSKTKLICKVTRDTVNKSVEHILKHINGSKFLLSSGRESMKIQEPEEGALYGKSSYRFKKIRVRERRNNLRKKRQKDYGVTERNRPDVDGNPNIDIDSEA